MHYTSHLINQFHHIGKQIKVQPTKRFNDDYLGNCHICQHHISTIKILPPPRSWTTFEVKSKIKLPTSKAFRKKYTNTLDLPDFYVSSQKAHTKMSAEERYMTTYSKVYAKIIKYILMFLIAANPVWMWVWIGEMLHAY